MCCDSAGAGDGGGGRAAALRLPDLPPLYAIWCIFLSFLGCQSAFHRAVGCTYYAVMLLKGGTSLASRIGQKCDFSNDTDVANLHGVLCGIEDAIRDTPDNI